MSMHAAMAALVRRARASVGLLAEACGAHLRITMGVEETEGGSTHNGT